MSQSTHPTIETLIEWLQSKATRGELPATTARLKETALRQLVSVLGEEEPRDVASLTANLDDIARRFATLHPEMKADSVKTYASRARAALDDYSRWLSDPTSFRFRPPKVDAPTKAKESANASHDSRKAEAGPVGKGEKLRDYPLDANRDFVFRLPPEGLSVDDVRRIGAHLLTLARDWNAPGSPVQPTLDN